MIRAQKGVQNKETRGTQLGRYPRKILHYSEQQMEVENGF
jgi:hypothetical protein